MKIETYKIETKDEADRYLKDLLKNPANRLVEEVRRHASLRVKDTSLRDYFIKKGEETLIKIKNKSKDKDQPEGRLGL